MFRELRRNKQYLTNEECIAILNNATSGVLAVLGDEDYPYAVPLSFVYDDNKIYFHCAKSGHKLEAIQKHDKVSFCIIDKDEIIPQEYTTYFRSVIVFGKAHVIENEADKRKALGILAKKYSPKEVGIEQEIDRFFESVCMVQIDIDHMTGKEAKELAMKK
ncbi:pyridoxamine 5'-phosphate oxidase family protein [Anaerorhabdus sp.]|uniref:pyridoxamine 5'-phosphate oxidase family protein n=1 Tax=Anaerorhabdus sp. TaxID=1872524 RepID=UPI002FCBE0F0